MEDAVGRNIVKGWKKCEDSTTRRHATAGGRMREKIHEEFTRREPARHRVRTLQPHYMSVGHVAWGTYRSVVAAGTAHPRTRAADRIVESDRSRAPLCMRGQRVMALGMLHADRRRKHKRSRAAVVGRPRRYARDKRSVLRRV